MARPNAPPKDSDLEEETQASAGDAGGPAGDEPDESTTRPEAEDPPVAQAAQFAEPAVDTRRDSTPGSPPDEPIIRIRPHAEGIFQAKELPLDQVEEPEQGYGEAPRNKLAMGIVLASLLLFLAAGVVWMQDEQRSAEIMAFLDGSIVEFKTAEVKRLEETWKNEDRASRNTYGDVTLVYFPADARVKVEQITWHQSGDSWRKNSADQKQVGTKELPNDTSKLTEGQTIERLPLLNLPIFETDKAEDGSVKDVYTYEYKITFEREGYHPREIMWRKDDWKRVGPGNFVIEWTGLDLVPKPETMMANFAKAMGEIFCLMKLKNIATLQEAGADENFMMILLRNGFKTNEDFQDANNTLTAGEHEAWWKARQEEISKQECK